MSLNIDWESFLINVQQVPKEQLDLLKVNNGDCLYIAERVDILLWWKENSKMHRYVSCIAAAVLAKPESNSLQERVFSCASLIDTDLRKSLGNEKFEMLCICSFNKKFIEEQDSQSMAELMNTIGSESSFNEAAEAASKFFDLAEDEADNPELDIPTFNSLLRSAAGSLSTSKKRSRKS